MKQKKGTFASVLSFAGQYRWKMMVSVVLAICSVAGGLLPYLGVYRIILLFFEGNLSKEQILPWIGLCAAGYLMKQVFHGLSTTFSHISAYHILENIRLALSEKLMRMPLGDTLSKTAGEWKSVIVDRVETIELPLAHMVPEGTSNLLLPVCVFAYMLVIDPLLALSALVCVPIGGIVYGIMMKNYSSQYDKYMKASNYVNSVIIEYTEGIQVIKAFNQSTGSYQKYADSVEDFKNFTLDWFRSTWGLMNLGAAILPFTLLGMLPAGILLYLSGGERQRIAIARAVLKDAPVVILDEATASVDPENEHLIQEAISELTHGKTIITIAHRLATIENADQILVIDGGTVAQRGTHEQLLGQEGTYREFVKIREEAEGWQIQ